MQEQTLELIDIYDITYNPWWLSRWFMGALITVVVLGCLAVVFFLYRKYRKKKAVAYWQKTIHDIQKLNSYTYDDGQMFYLKLTELIKVYLQKRYAVHVVDKTDSELLEILKENAVFPKKVYATLQEIFEGVIVIKFAHQQAAQERMQEALKKSITLVQETYKIPSPSTSSKAGR